MCKQQYINEYPLSALSSRYATEVLDDEGLKQYLVSVVDSAVYYDTWLCYFDYVSQHAQTVGEEIVSAALQAVGLDPYSVALWVRAIAACESTETRRHVYALGLAVPLYHKDRLADMCRESEGDEVFETLLPPLDVRAFGELVLSNEIWPSRYTSCATKEQQTDVRQQWMTLMSTMNANLDASAASATLQRQRIALAYRQMCAQLPHDDACWYEYALFQLRELANAAAALQTAQQGIRATGVRSFALQNIINVALNTINDIDAAQSNDASTLSTDIEAYFLQRATGDNLASCNNLSTQRRKEYVRALRRCGKETAANGVADWKVYSQWSTCEHVVNGDVRMAAKVLENGMVCCRAATVTTTNAILLGNEVIQYHLHNGQEREALGYAEQQVELASSSDVTVGCHNAAWNSLVCAEQLLGLRATKASARRHEFFPRSHITAFLEQYRVDNYLPCSEATYAWWRFAEDYASEQQQGDSSSVQCAAASRRALAPPLQVMSHSAPTKQYVVPDLSAWVLYKNDETAHPHTSASSTVSDTTDANPDDVAGPRELRGRWVYRVKPSAATIARVRREQLRRERTAAAPQTSNDVTNSNTSSLSATTAHNTALALLVRQLQTLTLTPAQKQRVSALSVDWLVQWLTETELDLADTIAKTT